MGEPPRQTTRPPSRGPRRDRPRRDLVIGPTLGQGGMGVVRTARQVTLDREVAVKTIRPKLASKAASRMLLQEALILGRLDHPNILPIHDIHDESGELHIVLKKVEGLEWCALMHRSDLLREQLGVDDALRWNIEILMTVCNAVHFAHSRGVVHRDLKPENVMIGCFGELYLMDWGLAVCLEDDGTGRYPLARDATSLAGTPHYMAPEMLGDTGQSIDERTDVYLLGAVLYEIVAGRGPHTSGSMDAMIERARRSRPKIPDGCPAELARICRRAMQRDKSARFESVEAFRDALAGFQKHADSRRLTKLALERTEVLLSRLAVAQSRADHEHVEHLFAECRFAYRQALEGWPDNEAAKEGLSRATAAMVEHELDQCHVRSAARLLRLMPDPPRALRERTERSLRRAAEREQRLAELDRADERHLPGLARHAPFASALSSLIAALASALAIFQR